MIELIIKFFEPMLYFFTYIYILFQDCIYGIYSWYRFIFPKEPPANIVPFPDDPLNDPHYIRPDQRMVRQRINPINTAVGWKKYHCQICNKTWFLRKNIF